MRHVLIDNLSILTSFLSPDFMHSFSNTVSSLLIFTLLCHFNILPFFFVAIFPDTILLSIAIILNRTIHANVFFPCTKNDIDFNSNIHSRLRAYFPSSMCCLTEDQASVSSFHDSVFEKIRDASSTSCLRLSLTWILKSSTDALIRNARRISSLDKRTDPFDPRRITVTVLKESEKWFFIP